MMKEPEERRRGRGHSLLIEGRQRAVIHGVEELDSFHEREIVLYTEMGPLTIEGEGLHIERLNLDDGQLIISGEIEGAAYMEEEKGGGLFGRLLRR